MERKIDGKQIKLLHIAQTELRISDAEYRELLIKFSPTSWDMDPNKPSCKSMTYAEASALLDHFKARGFVIKGKQLYTGPRRGKPYKGQVRSGSGKEYESSIGGLRDEIGDIAKDRWGAGWERPLNTFLHNRFGVHHYKFLDVTTGLKVKRALIAMETAGPYAKEKKYVK